MADGRRNVSSTCKRMDIGKLTRENDYRWRIEPHGDMRVPGILFGDRALMEALDDKVCEQLRNVATLPGIVGAAYAMPDAHWGYGFPIGGVAAFAADEGGIVSAGGVGFDISCGVRTLTTNLEEKDLAGLRSRLADELFASVPAGVGSTGRIHLDDDGMRDMLTGGARWAVEQGYGTAVDLERIEEGGRVAGAAPDAVSAHAKNRQRDEMGTLGSGNHYLEVQRVDRVFAPDVAAVFGLAPGQLVVSIHCGSRGLGHQIGTDYLREMVLAAPAHGIRLPDRELACAPLESDLGRRYLGAARAAMNCALANRQIITHLTRTAIDRVLPGTSLDLLFDVSHNICKEETHAIAGEPRNLFVHRKGATRAFGPGNPALPEALRSAGQPVMIGGSMGTASYVLAGVATSEDLALSSSCHGAGRAMSRNQARKRWRGRQLVDELAARGTIVRSPSLRGVAEEAPGAYKDVDAVVDLAEHAGLSRKVARLVPLICIKG
jgi:tRNA-splicing ligase RtcB